MGEIATVFNFAVVVAVLWYFGRKPVSEFLSTRSRDVAQAMEEAAALSRDAGRELSEWESRWASAKSEVQDQQRETQEILARQKENVLAQSKKEAVRIRQEAVLIAQSERVKAEQDLKNELIHKSVEMARRYLGTHLEEKDRHKLVADYLEIVRNGDAR